MKLYQHNTSYTLINHQGMIYEIIPASTKNIVKKIGKSNGFIPAGKLLKRIPGKIKRTCFDLNKKTEKIKA